MSYVKIFNSFVMASLNKFKSTNVLNMSHNELHLMATSSLYPTHTIISKVPQSSSEFQTDSTTKTREVFQCLAKKGISKADFEYIPLSMVKLLITLCMVYQYTQSLQRYRRPFQLSLQRVRKPLKDIALGPRVMLKAFQRLMGVTGEN